MRGVEAVAQGFIASALPDDAFSEAVLVDYEEARLPVEALIEAHLRTHASTARHSMRDRYRSAIYVTGEERACTIEDVLGRLAPNFDRPLVTRVLPLVAFEPSKERFHDYYRTDPSRPFCRTYIDPKLALLRREFAGHLADGRSP